MQTKILLASQSESRKAVLQQAGLEFTVEVSKFDEESVKFTQAHKYVQTLAEKKAEIVANNHKQAIVIAGDTIVVHNKKVLQKPIYKMEAYEVLHQLSDSTQIVYSGWALVHTHYDMHPKQYSGYTKTEVTFRKLSSEEIEAYVNNNPVTTWAAGWNSTNSSAITFIASVKGSYNGMNGLPIEEFISYIA